MAGRSAPPRRGGKFWHWLSMGDIVHRDLKPENVMLVPDPERPGEQRVKILDFGIAKLSMQGHGADGKLRTETGAMIGTPRQNSSARRRLPS